MNERLMVFPFIIYAQRSLLLWATLAALALESVVMLHGNFRRKRWISLYLILQKNYLILLK